MSELSKKILHIEDDADLQRYIATLLSGIAKVTSVGTLEEARLLISKIHYDLFIVDFTLPDGSGSEIIVELAKKDPSLPVVVFSAHDITNSLINVRNVFVKGRFLDREFIEAVHNLLA